MKVKNFKRMTENRLTKKEMIIIHKTAKLELEILKSLKQNIATAVISYMNDEKIGFNDLVTKLNTSPTQVSRIIKGEANLTLATIAHLFANMKHRPRFVASERKFKN